MVLQIKLKIRGKLIIICIFMFLMTSYPNHQYNWGSALNKLEDVVNFQQILPKNSIAANCSTPILNGKGGGGEGDKFVPLPDSFLPPFTNS